MDFMVKRVELVVIHYMPLFNQVSIAKSDRKLPPKGSELRPSSAIPGTHKRADASHRYNRKGMKTMHILTFLKGVAIGAGFMYLFDPSRGRTRRARIRDKAIHAWNEAGESVESCTRDFANRTQGVIHDLGA